MTTANVLSQALKLMGSAGSEMGLPKLQTGTPVNTGFGQVMSDSLKNQPGNRNENAEAVKQSSSPKQFASKPVTEKADAVKPETAGSEKITSETVKAVEDGIRDMVKEELGLTDEELEAAMAVLGLDYLSLLMPANMKALLLEVNQADAIELLTNEGLASQLETLLQGVEDILTDAGIEMPSMEDMQTLIEDMLEAKVPQEGLTAPETEAPAEQPAEEKGPEVEILVEKPDTEKVDDKQSETEMPEETEMQVTDTKDAPAEKQEASVKTEAESKDFQNAGKQEREYRGTGDENHQNPMETILQNLSSHVSVDDVAATAAGRLEVMRDIVNQVIEQIRINIRPEHTSMELTLNPENLGKINLTVVSRDGHLTASFTAQNEVTKEALESQVQNLKETLSGQGIKVDAIEVNIESFAFDERNQMNGGQEENGQSKPKEKKLSAEAIAKAFGEESESGEDTLDTTGITQSGSNVDYTA